MPLLSFSYVIFSYIWGRNYSPTWAQILVVFLINNQFWRNTRAHRRRRWAHFLETYIICFQKMSTLSSTTTTTKDLLSSFFFPSFWYCKHTRARPIFTWVQPGSQYIRLALSLITCYHQHFPSKFRSFVGHCSRNSSYFLTSLEFQIYWALNITLRSCTAPPNTKMMTRVVPCPSHFVPDWGPVYPKPKLEVFRTGHAIGDGSCVIYAFQAGFPD